MTLTIEIDVPKQKSLEAIAANKGKNVSEIVKEVIDDFLKKQTVAEKNERSATKAMMKLSESSFAEWDNEEDAIYDTF